MQAVGSNISVYGLTIVILFCLQHGSESVTGYVNVAKHQKASQESDYMYIEGLPSHPVQKKQERHNDTLVPPGEAAVQHNVLQTAPQPRPPPAWTQDPKFYSRTHDYVNLTPEECVSIAKAVPTPKEAKKPHATPRSHKPQRRAASMETDQVISRKKSDYASLPQILCSTEGGEGDISNMIDMEIQKEATELATSPERDARRNTLKHVPFDPYLKCLYCNRMFRYGEIQKYKKHVLTCTESSS